MKRLSWLFVLVTLVTLAACDPAPVPAPVPEPIPEPIPEPVPDPVPPPVACAAVERYAVDRLVFPVKPKIVGGIPAQPGQYPWMVALAYPSGFQYCGGSLISDRWVLTAAHCTVEPGDVAVINRLNLLDTDGLVVRVKRVLIHYGYDGNHNDVSLVELSEPVSLSIPTVLIGDAPQSGTATAIGYGLTTEGGVSSDVLMQVDVPIVSNEVCSSSYQDVTPSKMCAGRMGKDSCNGDSGGPLMFDGKQAGITAYGLGCAREGYPGVYTRVSAYQDWIEACTQ